MPANSAPHKAGAPDPGQRHRLRMCELLVQGSPGLSASELEIERGGESFTVDTLTAVHASHPDAELTFIVGADTASTVPEWREPARLLELARIAVAARMGTKREHVLRSLERVGGEGEHDVTFLEMPTIDVSSAEVRARVARGEPIEELVGAEVAGYIAEHGLYRDAQGGEG
jgi:nicotinate-nucleotide adenylyltransferase